jgi:transposase
MAPRSRRRSWSAERRRQIVADATAPGASVAGVALLNDVNANLVFKWIREARLGKRERRRSTRKEALQGVTLADSAPSAFMPVRIVEEAKRAAPTTLKCDPLGERGRPVPVCGRPRGAITITLPNGARIEIEADAGEAALRLALSVVKAF